MSQLVGIGTTMLYLVALYLLATNADGVTKVISGFGDTWFAGLRVLQGRD